MFQSLADKLENAFKKFKGKGKLTESDVKQAMREVRIALLEADVNINVVKQFTAAVSEKAVGQEILKSLSPTQQVIKIVNEELISLMGEKNVKLEVAPKPPTVIMMVGLQGAGKTTTAGKLANYLKRKHKKPLLVAGDVYRPAAITQLQVLGEQLNVPVFTLGDKVSPVEIAQKAMEKAHSLACDTVIIDTAGRLHINEELMEELRNIKGAVHPQEILLVVDAMTGQDAVTVAESFDKELGIDGLIVTKLDGDARGGAVLSVKAVTGKPVKLIGLGEKLDALEPFHPDRMASRILGMGDVVSLVERAQEQFDEEEARKLKKKLVKNQFDFNDFISQIQQIKKMGNLKDLASMIPGVGKMLKNVDIPDDVFKQTEAIISSMTPAEREHPEIINARRRERIAKGSGTTMADVNRLLKQFDDTRKMMKMVAGGGKMKLPQMPRGFRR